MRQMQRERAQQGELGRDQLMESAAQSEPVKRRSRGRFARLSSLFSLSDEEAMLRFQTEGDSGAFALLVRRWEGPIRRLCTRMTGDAHRGEDLAQETFARLFANPKAYQHKARFSTFLWRVALNLCYEEHRKVKRRNESSFDCEGDEESAGAGTLVSSVASPEAQVAERERAELVRTALRRLPEHYRAVVVLRHYEGLKFREIAEALDIPVGTVKSRMAEALNRLGRLLRPTLGEETP